MDDKKNYSNDSDAYELLKRQFKSFGSSQKQDKPEDDVKNSGEIYFSANSDSARSSRSQQTKMFSTGRSSYSGRQSSSGPYSSYSRSGSAQSRTSSASGSASSVGRSYSERASRASASSTSGTQRTAAKKRTTTKSKKQQQTNNIILTVGVVVFVIVAAMLVRIPVMHCIEDILAINADSTQIRVVVTEGMTVNDIIETLGDKNLIHNTGFCKLAAKLLDYDKKSDGTDRTYPAGEYNLSSSMGLEGMLNTILSAGSTDSTVKITFPEGYTVSQIAAKLSENGVCDTTDFYAALNDTTLLEQYDFLSDLTDTNLRYRVLEGYLYPDTYEFYIGENASSVVKRFLDNFEDKWDDLFEDSAKNSKYTTDQIIIVASIIEREAKNAEQMPLISSVIYNRLESSSFPYINCDSTAKYISAYEEELTATGSYSNYLKAYDTNQRNGLPAGPICNPGKSAIAAAISPDSTDYYYFLHDSDGKLYLASTLSEHERNKKTAGIS